MLSQAQQQKQEEEEDQKPKEGHGDMTRKPYPQQPQQQLSVKQLIDIRLRILFADHFKPKPKRTRKQTTQGDKQKQKQNTRSDRNRETISPEKSQNFGNIDDGALFVPDQPPQQLPPSNASESPNQVAEEGEYATTPNQEIAISTPSSPQSASTIPKPTVALDSSSASKNGTTHPGEAVTNTPKQDVTIAKSADVAETDDSSNLRFRNSSSTPQSQEPNKHDVNKRQSPQTVKSPSPPLNKQNSVFSATSASNGDTTTSTCKRPDTDSQKQQRPPHHVSAFPPTPLVRPVIPVLPQGTDLKIIPKSLSAGPVSSQFPDKGLRTNEPEKPKSKSLPPTLAAKPPEPIVALEKPTLPKAAPPPNTPALAVAPTAQSNQQCTKKVETVIPLANQDRTKTKPKLEHMTAVSALSSTKQTAKTCVTTENPSKNPAATAIQQLKLVTNKLTTAFIAGPIKSTATPQQEKGVAIMSKKAQLPQPKRDIHTSISQRVLPVPLQQQQMREGEVQPIVPQKRRASDSVVGQNYMLLAAKKARTEATSPMASGQKPSIPSRAASAPNTAVGSQLMSPPKHSLVWNSQRRSYERNLVVPGRAPRRHTTPAKQSTSFVENDKPLHVWSLKKDGRNFDTNKKQTNNAIISQKPVKDKSSSEFIASKIRHVLLSNVPSTKETKQQKQQEQQPPPFAANTPVKGKHIENRGPAQKPKPPPPPPKTPGKMTKAKPPPPRAPASRPPPPPPPRRPSNTAIKTSQKPPSTSKMETPIVPVPPPATRPEPLPSTTKKEVVPAPVTKQTVPQETKEPNSVSDPKAPPKTIQPGEDPMQVQRAGAPVVQSENQSVNTESNVVASNEADNGSTKPAAQVLEQKGAGEEVSSSSTAQEQLNAVDPESKPSSIPDKASDLIITPTVNEANQQQNLKDTSENQSIPSDSLGKLEDESPKLKVFIGGELVPRDADSDQEMSDEIALNIAKDCAHDHKIAHALSYGLSTTPTKTPDIDERQTGPDILTDNTNTDDNDDSDFDIDAWGEERDFDTDHDADADDDDDDDDDDEAFCQRRRSSTSRRQSGSAKKRKRRRRSGKKDRSTRKSRKPVPEQEPTMEEGEGKDAAPQKTTEVAETESSEQEPPKKAAEKEEKTLTLQPENIQIVLSDADPFPPPPEKPLVLPVIEDCEKEIRELALLFKLNMDFEKAPKVDITWVLQHAQQELRGLIVKKMFSPHFGKNIKSYLIKQKHRKGFDGYLRSHGYTHISVRGSNKLVGSFDYNKSKGLPLPVWKGKGGARKRLRPLSESQEVRDDESKPTANDETAPVAVGESEVKNPTSVHGEAKNDKGGGVQVIDGAMAEICGVVRAAGSVGARSNAPQEEQPKKRGRKKRKSTPKEAEGLTPTQEELARLIVLRNPRLRVLDPDWDYVRERASPELRALMNSLSVNGTRLRHFVPFHKMPAFETYATNYRHVCLTSSDDEITAQFKDHLPIARKKMSS